MSAVPLSVPKRRSIRSRPATITWYLAVAAISVLMLIPFFWVITTALKGTSDIYRIPPQFIPSEFHWENFARGVEAINFGRLFVNSTIITLVSTVGAVASSMIVGYGLSRIRFPGRKLWFYLFVGSMMLPAIVTLIPTFRLFLALGWYDSWLPLIVPAWLGNPLFIFLARQYYLSIPYEIDEAAKLDGADHWTIFSRIMVPMTRPLWITMAILAFQASWNDYLNPLVYLPSDDKWTLALGLASFSGSFAGVSTTQWNLYMATNLLYMLPPLLLFFVAQRYFMTGLSALGGSSRASAPPRT